MSTPNKPAKINIFDPHRNYTKGTWVNTKTNEIITGKWLYIRATDSFHIILDSRDPITGEQRSLSTGWDTPKWGNWKLQEQEK